MSEFLSTADAEHQHADDRRSRSAVPPIRATDGERLMRFWRHRDESAFAEVVELHAGLVWGVCSQILRRREDVEDAFQATFLILARKAKSIRAADSAAGWLYRVAFRTALLARNRRLRTTEESLVHEPATDDDQLAAIARNEQCLVLLEELHALPTQYRQPLVLCYLEGRSRSEAADELGVTPQTVKGALARGTRMLRSRLVSRGAALSTTMAVVSASIVSAQAAAPPLLVSHTAALGAGFALKLSGAGSKAAAAKGGAATILAEKGILAMTIAAASKPAVAVLGVCLTAGMLAVATADAPKGEPAEGAQVVLLADDEAGSDESEAASAEFGLAEPVADKPKEASASTSASAPPAGAYAASGWALVPADASAQGRTAASPPSDVLITNATNPVGGVIPVRTRYESEAGVVSMYLPEPPNPPSQPGSRFPLTRTPATSEASLKLEAEYWDIKARALRKKADALSAHAKAASESGQQSSTETLAAEAEAELTLAEVKMCEMNALRVKEAIDAVEASQLKEGAVGPEVEAIQRALNQRMKLSPPLDADGEFGPLTEQAVMKFQKSNRLKASGVVDEATWASLESRDRTPWKPETFEMRLDAPPNIEAQRAMIEVRAREAEVQAAHAAEAAVAAAGKAGRQAEQAAKAETREERILAGGAKTGWAAPAPVTPARVMAKPEALIEMERQLKELQKANEQLQEQLKELEESHRTSRY